MRVALLFLCATCTLPGGEADPSSTAPEPPPQLPSDLEYIPEYSTPEALGKAYGHDKSKQENIPCNH